MLGTPKKQFKYKKLEIKFQTIPKNKSELTQPKFRTESFYKGWTNWPIELGTVGQKNLTWDQY
jgi:hypothetical protein